MGQHRSRTISSILFLLLAFLVLDSRGAGATAILQISSGGSTVTVADGSPLDSSPFAGVILYAGSVGTWSLNVSTGTSKPALEQPQLDLGSVNLAFPGSSPSPITISLTDTGFTYLPSPGLTAAIGGTTPGTVSFDAYFDATNDPFGTGTLISSLGPFKGAFSGSGFGAIAPFPLTGPFSLTEVITIEQSGAGVTSFDAAIAPAPEPGTVVLFGLSLIGFAVWGRRRALR